MMRVPIQPRSLTMLICPPVLTPLRSSEMPRQMVPTMEGPFSMIGPTLLQVQHYAWGRLSFRQQPPFTQTELSLPAFQIVPTPMPTSPVVALIMHLKSLTFPIQLHQST